MADTLAVSVSDQAVALIDGFLPECVHRELLSTDEVADFLLDVRSLLAKENS